MNAEQLLAHFERISEAPDAIARLRRFILDLAVRGKLVEQDPEDEPVPLLLDEIKSRMRRLRLKHAFSVIDPSEIPFDEPTGWTWCRLGEVCEKTGSGSTPRGGKDVYKNSGVPFLRSQNIYNYGLRLDDVAFIDVLTHERMAGTRVLPCDLLLNITGGSIERCAKVPLDFGEANISQHVAIIRMAERGMEEFFHSLILSPYFQGFVGNSQTGAGRGGLPKNRMDAIPVPLPPLAEQHRIVAKVDELMALCDELEAARQERQQGRERLVAATLQRLNQPAEDPASFRKDASFALQVLPSLTTTPAQIKQLRQTILNLAVRGKLVEQDPDDEPAGELLACVSEEKVRKSSNRPKKADAIMSADSADHKLFSLHKGWQWTTLEDYSLDVSTGPFGSMLHQSDYIVNGVPIVNPSHMIGGRICPDSKVTVSSAMAGRLASYKLTEGDIVMARRGEVGRAALVTEEEEGWFCGTGSFIVRFIPETLRAYLLLFLSADLARGYLLGSAIGATMTNLNHGILKKMPIPLPPLAEQHRIVAKVDDLMALCDQLEQQLSQADQQRRRLLEAVLAEALLEPEQALAAMT